MKLEEGACYRSRHGSVYGPVKFDGEFFVSGRFVWRGTGAFRGDGESHPLDLISRVYVSDTPPPVKKERRSFEAGDKVRFVEKGICNLVTLSELLQEDPRIWRANDGPARYYLHERQITHRIVKKPRAARREFWVDPSRDMWSASKTPKDGWIHVREVKEKK